MSADVDAQLEEQFTTPMGGLLAVALGSPRVREQLGADLLRLATRRAEQLATSPELVAAVSLPQPSPDGEVQSIDGIELPSVPCQGGSYAVLETKPGSAAEGGAWEATTPDVATLAGVGSQAVRCCEAWNLSLPRIAMNLIDNRRDCIEFADRVSSRCDVDWTPLGKSTEQPPATALAFPIESSPLTMTQVL